MTFSDLRPSRYSGMPLGIVIEFELSGGPTKKTESISCVKNPGEGRQGTTPAAITEHRRG